MQDNAEKSAREFFKIQADAETANKVIKMIDAIEDLDDVQDVYHNAQLDGVPE
jgi:transcriptional/translational regulatory protein YebC/TACO1